MNQIEFYNPYNDSKIEDVAPTQTSACGVNTSSAACMVIENVGGYDMNDNPNRLFNIYGEHCGTGFAGNVWGTEAISPAIMTMQGGNREPMVLDEQNGYIRNDGTVGTTTTDGSSPKHNNRVIEEAKVVGGVGEMKSNNGTQWYMQDRVYDGDVSISVCSAENPNYVDRQFRIRKLTPRECWRLMDFTDEDFEKAREVCSDSRLYMQAGNSIVVKCLELIFRQMM